MRSTASNYPDHMGRSQFTILLLSTAVSLGTLAEAYPSAEIEWSFQASATAGAALIASQAGVELVRLGCRRSPAQLFVMVPHQLKSTETITVHVNEGRFVLRPDPDGGSASADLLPQHVDELANLTRLRLEGESINLDLRVPPDQASATQLGHACRDTLAKL